MSSAPAFSRLQLAAALLEYDNDPTNPNAPVTKAQDSAIFAHFRRNPAAPPQLSSRKSDYLGVSLPTETGSLGGRESLLDTTRRSRASRGSLHTLRNPFGPDDLFSDEEGSDGGEEELEVDLASWGLDSLIPKEKGKSAKGKAKAAVPPPHAVSSVLSHFPLTNDGHPTLPKRAINTSRSVSLGGIAEYPGINNSPLGASKRRKSFGSPLDFAGMEVSQFPVQRPRRLSYSAAQRPSSSALQSIPFPSSSARSPSPHFPDELHGRRVSVGSRFEPKQSIIEARKLSRASTEMMLQDEQEGLPYDTPEQADDNPFAVRPPSPSRLSRFDPKATSHARTYSSGSKLPPEQEAVPSSQDSPRRERKFSTTLDLLRPKILVMPSPLQPVSPDAPPPKTQVRDGFLLSTDGPPLPPGARSSRHVSTIAADLANKPPIASNSFTPNPLINLSLSQMTFRNTLHVGGQRGPYSEITAGLPRATEDGEQIEFIAPERDDNPLPPNASAGIGTDHARPAGKLFGKSLIDDLEMRKAQLRSKQRVFTGDQRPSMMSRQLTRSSTLIDPATLVPRPTILRQSSLGAPDSHQPLSRRNSSNAKPLLNFDDEGEKFKPTISGPRMISSRSVFGVDTLWDREMAKLHEIQAEEEKEKEEQKKRMEQEEQKKKRRKKRKLKKKGLEGDASVDAEAVHQDGVEARVSIEPPTLPNIARATRRPPKATEEDDDDDDDNESDDQAGLPTHAPADDAGQWFSDSDGEGPRRTTGVGPRYLSQRRRAPKIEDNDSDEDLPLSMAVNKAAARLQHPDDSDEEKPLSSLMQKKTGNIPPINAAVDDGDDDDKPLGLRASTVANHLPQGGDDDDTPLAFHPEQQRRTQYQMFAQQQQQQQQLMMQAQFQNSMFFGPPSMYGSGFFAPPVMPAMPMMMQPPIPMPSPPPAQDTAKFGRVDKWRHDVAVEGDH
ncbi:hypothetical protein JOM56_008606 [Amanita muscaria]